MRFVKSPHLQLALRELRAAFAAPSTLGAMGAVIVLLVLAGPFGTSVLPPLKSAAYWGTVVLLTYAAGTFLGALMEALWPEAPAWRRVGLFALANGLFVTALLAAINLAFAHFHVIRWSVNAEMLLVILPVAMLISGLIMLVEERKAPAPAAKAPLLMDRLAPPLRGPLIALSAEDHYTRIRTAKGEDLVLVPLRDAIREAAPTEGLQVHRSHWVATAHIAQVLRGGGKARVVLSDGTELPVSRSNAPRLRELGF